MIMPSDAVELRIDGHVATIVLNRPDSSNALTRSMLADLRQAFSDLHLEKRVRAVILTGAGDSFSIGRDPNELTGGDDLADMARWGEEADEYRELLAAMLELPKTIIAAVNGPALAGGAGLAMACDAVLAADAATFGFEEPKRGLVAGVAAPLLAFRTSGGVAAKLLLTASVIDSAEALRLGVFHEVVASEVLWARAFELGNQVAEAAPQAINLTKRLVLETLGEQLLTQLSSGAIASATARTTESAREGLAAQKENRDPEWP